jgi:hypothetical protein
MIRNILSLLIVTLLTISCNQQQSDQLGELATVEETILGEQSQKSSPPSIDQNGTQEVTKKKIIKDGRLGMRVSDLVNTKTRIDTLIDHYGGYYANEKLTNSDWEIAYHLKIRIPSAHFMRFISDTEMGEGEILYKEIDARDITDQFIDLETRLDNKRNYQKRYNDLLLKANSIKEILEIEEKIRALEEEIESTTGQLLYLSDLVDYSTLELTISQQRSFKYNPAKRDKFSEKVKQSFSKGWFGLVDFFLFVINIWPFWIILTLIIYAWKKYKMKVRRK